MKQAQWMRVSSAWIAAIGLCLGGCDLIGGPAVVGSGKPARDMRTVSRFNAINVAGSGRLIVRQTGWESLKIQADDNILPLIESEVVNGELRLGIRDHGSVEPRTPIVYEVTVKDLNAIRLSGSLSARIDSIHTDQLDFSISGSGEATVSGSARRQTIDISGSGDYDASACAGQSAQVDISGSGHVIVRVLEDLDAGISGSGSIEYIGSPNVTAHISGSGGVHRRS